MPLPLELTPGPVTRPLRESIEAAIADIIPEDKQGAVLAIAGREGATVVGATRVGDHWKIGGEVHRKWGGRVEGRVMVIGAW